MALFDGENLVRGPGLRLFSPLGKKPKELVKAHEQRNFSLLLALLVGVLAGTANSLFGIGGGVIMVPALVVHQELYKEATW